MGLCDLLGCTTMSVTLSGITYDLDQRGWGSTRLYDDLSLDGLWVPDKVVVHWGGSTIPPSTTWGINRLFQGWQRYHIGKGWQDIAYGAGVGNDGLTRRLRGWNHQGATSGDYEDDGIPENSEAFACVWAGGSGGPISAKAYAAMAKIVQNVLDVIGGVPVVIGHRDVKGNTTCPGNEWWDWVQAEGWSTAPPPPPPTMEDEMFLPLHYGDGMEDGQELMYPDGHMWAGKTFTTDRENRRSDVRFMQGALRRAGASVNTDGFYTVETAAAVVKVTPITAADTNGFDIHGNDADPIMAAAYGGGGGVPHDHPIAAGRTGTN
jgi:hypothetical protein